MEITPLVLITLCSAGLVPALAAAAGLVASLVFRVTVVTNEALVRGVDGFFQAGGWASARKPPSLAAGGGPPADGYCLACRRGPAGLGFVFGVRSAAVTSHGHRYSHLHRGREPVPRRGRRGPRPHGARPRPVERRG